MIIFFTDGEIDMRKFKENWNKASLLEKILLIAVFIIALTVIILSSLGVLNIIPLELTNSIVQPMLAAFFLLNGITVYKKNKTTGIIFIVCSAIIFVCCAVVFIPRFIH